MKDIVKEFSVNGQDLTPVVMDDYNSDWDPLYPFSAVSLFYVDLYSCNLHIQFTHPSSSFLAHTRFPWLLTLIMFRHGSMDSSSLLRLLTIQPRKPTQVNESGMLLFIFLILKLSGPVRCAECFSNNKYLM